MAKIIYEVKKNQNSYSGGAFGREVVRADQEPRDAEHPKASQPHLRSTAQSTLPTSSMAYSRSSGSCLIEMLLNSKKVKIEGLGTFYCTLENQKKGALKKEDFNPNKHLKALHIRFLPEQAAEENISSREFLKKAEFVNIEQLLLNKEEEEGTEGGGSQSGGSDTGSDSSTGSETAGGGNTQGGSDTGGSTGGDNGGDGDDGLDQD